MQEHHYHNELLELLSNQSQPISFSAFMEITQYHPNWGYYQQNKDIIGEKGDFTTAPEISSLFTKCLCNAIINYAQHFQIDLSQSVILEIGAGNGTLAIDLIQQLQTLNKPIKQYQIIEKSQCLKQKQQKRLAKYKQTLKWLQQPTHTENRIIIANEIMDALPFNIGQTKKINNQWQWQEKMVQVKKAKNNTYTVQWCWSELKELPEEIDSTYCVENRIMEIPQALCHWLSTLRKTQKNGFIIFFDYAERDSTLQKTHLMGNLKCYKNHQLHHNPFINFGKQDITAQVNIDLLVRQAQLSNWQPYKICNQAKFLINNHITQFLDDFQANTDSLNINHQLYQLTSPETMGEKFKMMLFKT